jgi:gliding motility-associated lipoprotein GldH
LSLARTIQSTATISLLPKAGWNKDSVARFSVDITETGMPCNVLVNIRHNNTYPYQNFWLFIATTSPDGKTTQDTIECYLTDNRGKWLGSGLSSVYNMPVLFKPNTVLKPGKYTFAIRQGMRDDVLTGITDIGIEIRKKQVKRDKE